MIYSEAFEALPLNVKRGGVRADAEILTSTDEHPGRTRLSAADRRAILEILRETRPDFDS